MIAYFLRVVNKLHRAHCHVQPHLRGRRFPGKADGHDPALVS